MLYFLLHYYYYYSTKNCKIYLYFIRYYHDHVECQECKIEKQEIVDDDDSGRNIPSPIDYNLSDLEITEKPKENTGTKNSESHTVPAASNLNQMELESTEESPSLFDLAKPSKNFVNIDKNLISSEQSDSDKDSNESAGQR